MSIERSHQTHGIIHVLLYFSNSRMIFLLGMERYFVYSLLVECEQANKKQKLTSMIMKKNRGMYVCMC